jgi:hypothetical protein
MLNTKTEITVVLDNNETVSRNKDRGTIDCLPSISKNRVTKKKGVCSFLRATKIRWNSEIVVYRGLY